MLAIFPVTVKVSEIIQHPEYDTSVVPVNDVALLKLKTFVEFTAFIQPICLPKAGPPVSLEDQPLVMSGWGNTQNLDRKAADVLQFVGVGKVAFEECSKKWKK